MSVAASDTALTKVEVALGNRAYDIQIGTGLIAGAGANIARVAPGSACFIVSDENVAAAHMHTLVKSLDAAGIRHERIVLPPGESTKSYHYFEQVCDAVIAARMERRDVIVAFGGGVIGDLAGFVAATVRRGMPFVQIPTSLLAQVDSSVGGKTAINSPHGKNLIGAFYQPLLVLADTGALQTLSKREFKAGYAEVAKYGLIDDHSFFEWLEANWRRVFDHGPELTQAIATSCRSKAAVVARDETEQGDRALLNLGHTFGHALEALAHYDSDILVHGEGVSVGLALAFRFSQRLGHCNGQDATRVAAHLQTVGLPTKLQDIRNLPMTTDTILDAMFQDKKVQRGALTFILARGIGQSFIARGVDVAQVRGFLDDELAGH